MPDQAKLTIEKMRRADVDYAIRRAAAEGWNPGVHDAECFYAADPDGFFVARRNRAVAGCISAVAYGTSFGFIGLFIVEPELRGHRVGVELGRQAMHYLKDRTIGIDGVLNKVKNYEALGFAKAYENIRYAGKSERIASGTMDHPALVPLCTLPFETVAAYDAQHFPAPRTRFLEPWLNQADSLALGVVKNEKLAGYGVIRECLSGYKIGPLFADTPEDAELLFATLCCYPGENVPVFLDTPGVNPAAVRMAEQFDMKKVFATARMYTGAPPVLPMERIFGVTSFELG